MSAPTPTEAEPTGRELFVKIMAHITVYPQDWDQSNWWSRSDQWNSTCGTAGCIAGWACHLHGMLKVNGTMLPKYGDASIDTEAIRLLELPERYGHNLFGASNRMPDLYRIGAQLYHIEEEVLHKEVDKVIDEMRDEQAKWMLEVRKARRSAAAKKGWATRRAHTSG